MLAIDGGVSVSELALVALILLCVWRWRAQRGIHVASRLQSADDDDDAIIDPEEPPRSCRGGEAHLKGAVVPFENGAASSEQVKAAKKERVRSKKERATRTAVSAKADEDAPDEDALDPGGEDPRILLTLSPPSEMRSRRSKPMSKPMGEAKGAKKGSKKAKSEATVALTKSELKAARRKRGDAGPAADDDDGVLV